MTLSRINVFISLFVFFVLFLIGWYKFPGLRVWGLYTSIDGEFAEWYAKALFTWSSPFSISNVNPFEGMGSLFFPNNIWLNPGALALSLPLEKAWTYMISYGAYLIEVSFSIYCLARALSLSRVYSILCVQVFAFFLFPPFTDFTHAISFFSGAPFNAHLMALLNFCVALFIQLGKGSHRLNLLRISLIILLLFIAFYSGPITLLTYFPAYGIFSLGILVQDLKDPTKKRNVFLWRFSLLTLLILISVALDTISYILYTSQYATRLIHFQNTVSSTFIDSLKTIMRTLTEYKPCAYPQQSLICLQKRYPITVFHLLAFLGGIFGCFIRTYRWISLAFVCTMVLPEILLILIETRLFPILAALNPMFYTWSTYSFCAIFLVFFFGALLKMFLKTLTLRLSSSQSIRIPNNLFKKYFFNSSWLVFIGPLLALGIIYKINLFASKPALRLIEKTKIIEHLENSIKLEPGITFKGSTISYIGAVGGGIRPNLDDISFDHMNSDVYTSSREYLKKHYNTYYMMGDLWSYKIPTLEEYGQWITLPLFSFLKLLSKNPNDQFHATTLYVFDLNYTLLSTLGVRFIITDSKLSDPNVHQVIETIKEGAVPLYLYEVSNPNLGNYSPTQVKILESAQDIVDLFKKGDFDFENSVVLQKNLSSEKLIKAHDAKFSFDVNTVRAQAKSNGLSLIILPIQFSNCYKINSKNPNYTPKIMRANIVQTAILFKEHLDVELQFDFGAMRNASCREQDIQEIKALGLINKKE